MPRRIPALLAATAAAAVTTTVAVLSSASAQAPATRTLTFHEVGKGETFVHIRNTPTKARMANLAGDVAVLTIPFTDAAGAQAGQLEASCVTTVGNRDYRKATMLCNGILHLRDGDLTSQFLVEGEGAAHTVAAITGGTGAYTNARGTVDSTETKTGADDVITLVG